MVTCQARLTASRLSDRPPYLSAAPTADSAAGNQQHVDDGDARHHLIALDWTP